MTALAPPVPASLIGPLADPAPSRIIDSRPARVSVVIPTKNEAANIGWVLARIPAWVDEVIIVDGLSTDGTLDAARQCIPDIVVVNEKRRGKGAAVRAGFAAATGDIVVMIDADGSMDPGEIGRYVRAVEEGADLVKGSRVLDGGGSADLTTMRNLGNRFLLFGANHLFRTGFSELCYGFMAVRRQSIEALALVSDGFEIETEIVVRSIRCGLAISEVPSFEAPRRAGASNLNAARDGLRIVRTMLMVRLNLHPAHARADRKRATTA